MRVGNDITVKNIKMTMLIYPYLNTFGGAAPHTGEWLEIYFLKARKNST